MSNVSVKTALFVLSVLVVFKQCTCACKHSYQTTCDSIEDYEKFNDGTWTDVVIKSSSKNALKSVPFNVVKFRTLNSLTIIGQINGLGDTENTCVYDIKLKSLNFYSNSIKSIRDGNFLRFLNLHKLGLVNNGIEVLHRGAFSLPQIEVIDLSENKIEKIEAGVFTNELVKSRTRTRAIIIKNNKLSNIESNSFPDYLEFLKLDNNNLKVLRDGAVSELAYLQGLYLSNNQLSAFPNTSKLFNLKILDLSGNNIESVSPEKIGELKSLNYLNLSRNKITSINFLKPLLLKHEPLEIFMNFNLLQSLNDLNINTTLTDKTLNLYGNPWLCEEWRSVEDYMESIVLKRNKCDLEAFTNSNIEFCKDSYSKPIEEYVEEFYDEVVGKGYLLKCDFVTKKYENLFYKKSIDIQCRGG